MPRSIVRRLTLSGGSIGISSSLSARQATLNAPQIASPAIALQHRPDIVCGLGQLFEEFCQASPLAFL
jgi:hypothetical protein